MEHFSPEFAFLPRKFKIAVSGSVEDRAAIHFHDIGLQLVKNSQGDIGFSVLVGGGLGRTPVIASQIRAFLPEKDLLTYLDAILRIYNLHGRRDNKYKARIKILVRALGVSTFTQMVEDEWQNIRHSPSQLTAEELARMQSHFTPPAYQPYDDFEQLAAIQALRSDNTAFSHWLNHNVHPHKVPGYRAVTLSLKATGIAPGDITSHQLDTLAQWADTYSFGQVRVTHSQNLVMADVPLNQLHSLWQQLTAEGLATPNIGTLTDMICCPGGDFCSLANAKSIPVADAIQREFDQLDYLYDLGPLQLNISGCMNACGHHHIGHIGILGVDKKGEEFFQIQLGGNSGNQAALGEVLGPAFGSEQVPQVLRQILQVYLQHRQAEEPFIDTYQRIGLAPFKETVYAKSV